MFNQEDMTCDCDCLLESRKGLRYDLVKAYSKQIIKSNTYLIREYIRIYYKKENTSPSAHNHFQDCYISLAIS